MAAPWTSSRFPQFEAAIRNLTEQHRQLEDEPLHLAISYLPARRDQTHIYLFEVIGGFSENANLERDLFEATFEAASGFQMKPGEQLHLVLSTPQELQRAIREDWPWQ